MSERQAAARALAEHAARKGIPPFLLASNIYEPEYSEIRYWKENGCVRVETVSHDEGVAHRWTYYYDQDRRLLRLTHTLNGRTSPVWDREEETKRLAQEYVAAKKQELAHA